MIYATWEDGGVYSVRLNGLSSVKTVDLKRLYSSTTL